jgi:hypothetical protein
MAASRHVLAALALAVTAPPGFAAQPPVSALTIAQLVEHTDTVDVITRRGSGPLVRTATYLRSVRQTTEGGWAVEFRWFDTTGTATSSHRIETGRATMATRAETARSLTDSARLVVGDGRASGWVVPAGQQAVLVDTATSGAFANRDVALLAIAATKPGPGLLFSVPHNTLFSLNPAVATTDTLRTLAPARLRVGRRDVECQTLDGPNDELYWIERATGRLLAGRTRVGPFTHWHVVRGVVPPDS